jgi:hypothetical protein
MLRYAVKLSKDTNGTILVDVPAVPDRDRPAGLRCSPLGRSTCGRLEAAFRALGKHLTVEIRDAA